MTAGTSGGARERGAFDLSQRKRQLLEQLLRREGADASRYPGPVIAPRDADAPVRLSFAQERMWFLQQINLGSAAYSLPAALRLRGVLDADELDASLCRSARRHEVLRTMLPARDGLPRAELRDVPDALLRRVDVSAEPDAEQAALAVTQQEIERPFDLANGPLVRATLIRLSRVEHLLVLNMHHVVGDAWSWDVLLAEIAHGARPEPAERELQYSDFAAWQRQRLADGELDAQLDHWRRVLADPPAPLEVPGDRPRAGVPRRRGALLRVRIGADLVARLAELARGERATVFMVLLASFNALLHRVTGAPDIVLGTPISNRQQHQLDGLVGVFVNTLAVRARVNGRASFRELLRTVRAATVDAFGNCDVPFERLVQEAVPSRAGGQTPLFHIMFAYRTAPRYESIGPLDIEPVDVHNATSKRDLTLQLVETGGEVHGHLEYDTDLYDEGTVRSLLDSYLTLLDGVATDADRAVADLPLLDEPRRAAVLAASVGAPLPPQERCVHELIAEQAAATPDAVAVRSGAEQLSYAELDARADRLARQLVGLGVGPETTVGVRAGRGVGAVVAVLGVLKANGAYVPCEPGDPAARVRTMLDHAGARVLVQDDEQDDLPPYRCVRLPREGTPAPAPAPVVGPGNAAPVVGPGNAAYVLFTSGSTGAPKGVVVSHRNLAAYTRAAVRRLGLGGPLNHAMVQPLTVDSSLTMLFPPLCTGGTVHVVPRGVALDPVALAELMREESIDCLKIAPSHLRALEQAGVLADLLPRHRLIVGGEASPLDWLTGCAEQAGPDCQVHNHYGPTEATVGVTTYPVPGQRDARQPAEGATPLGTPLDGSQAYVLDDRMRLVPDGVAGELYLGGEKVARGYLGRPALTAEHFVPDPFHPLPGRRLYRTGDRTRRRADGSLEFLGRADEQVKIRGFRVEPGEVAAMLRARPDIDDAVVVARRGADGAMRLVGYVVPATGSDLDVATLRGRLRAALPEQLVPSAIMAIDAVPLSAHGKLDRSALPDPMVAGPGGGDAAAAGPQPGTDAERLIADLWARLLERDGEIPVDTNFFDVGGHSLLIVRLHHELQTLFGTRFELVELFNATTIASQAELLATRDPAEPDGTTARLQVGRERGRRQGEQARQRQQAARAGRQRRG